MIYNPLDNYYKSIIGAVPSKSIIKFRIRGSYNQAFFVLTSDDNIIVKNKMNKKDDHFEIDIKFDKGLYFYYFEVDNEFIIKSNDYLGIRSKELKHLFQLTSYDLKENKSWLSGGIIYQIFPDRFYSSKENLKNLEKGKTLHKNIEDIPYYKPDKNNRWNSDFYGGDLKGIKEKLLYLKALNVNCIYLNPIFKSYSNHRYDTGDYMNIDPLLGCEEDLIDLIETAKNYDIKIVLDGVFNHTGEDSKYFNKFNNYNSLGAFQSQNSPYYNWYTFSNYPNDYTSWWGVKSLPQIKKDSKDFFEYIAGENGVIYYYTKLGIAGWRLDVVDELSDEFVKKIAFQAKKTNKDAIIIGEVWEDASNKISYGKRREYFLGDELDSVMNYPLKNAIINFVINKDAKLIGNLIKTQVDHYPENVLNSLMNILSTHDTYRIFSALSDIKIDSLSKDEISKIKIPTDKVNNVFNKLKIATILQYTLPGVPSIYYGDEIGMQGFMDPFNRMFFNWGNVNDKILEWYILLGNIRKNCNVFVDGKIEILYLSDESIIYKRYKNDEEIIVAINLSKNKIFFTFDDNVVSLLSNKTYKNSYVLLSDSFDILIGKS